VDELELEARDDLTGFFLRKAFDPFVKKLVNDCRVTKKNFSMVHIDVDKFKKYNDKYGHYFGDLVLKYVTSTLNLSLGKVDHYIFRYGGDEFVILLPDKGPAEAYKTMQYCKYVLKSRPFVYGNNMHKVTLSVGISTYPKDGKEKAELLDKADHAMYFSKRHGRGNITYVGKIPLLKLKNALYYVFLLGCLIVLLMVAYQYVFPTYQALFKKFFPKISVQRNTDYIDIITFKNGRTMEGRILSETERDITINLNMQGGKGQAVFSKNEIKKIKYGNPDR